MDTQPTLTNRFGPSISKIDTGLFVGNEKASCDLSMLQENNITSVVSLVRDPLGRWGSPTYRSLIPQNRHLFIPVLDSDTQDILVHIPRICDFIDEQLAGPSTPESATDTNILIHCTWGISRSATAAIAYLMRTRHESLDVILEFVRTKRKVKPSETFLDQLRVWQEVEYEIWQDPTKWIPKPAYEAFLARRSEKLKAKGLTGNELVGIGDL
jgi:protein-tyrosine phosphatase